MMDNPLPLRSNGIWRCTAAVLVSVVLMPAAAMGDTPYGNIAAISDEQLAEQHGKFILPTGLEVNFSVQLDSFVDGQLALRTILTPETPQGPVVNVYALTHEDSVTLNGSAAASANGVPRPATGMPTSSLTVTMNGRAPAGEATKPLPVISASAPTVTVFGTVTIAPAANGTLVRLDDAGLQIRHLVGEATANAVANNVNGRAIDTLTTVSLDLQNATPLNLGSSIFRVDDAVVAAARGIHY